MIWPMSGFSEDYNIVLYRIHVVPQVPDLGVRLQDMNVYILASPDFFKIPPTTDRIVCSTD